MRTVPALLKQRLESAQQTLYNNGNPSTILWLSRKNIAFRNEMFLEKTLIATKAGLETSSIAERHMRLKREPDRVYVGYVANGRAGVVYANTVSNIKDFVWTQLAFDEPALDISVAFDGTMPKNVEGKVEFITEETPWIFWVTPAGSVMAQYGDDKSTRVTLANNNATKVSAVRAMWSEVGDFDFGLCLFMIISEDIYYRQYINGVWNDAIPVNFGPENSKWVDIAAYRTWDYRICLQGKGKLSHTVQELFTQYAGIAKQNTEHIEIRNVKATGKMTRINYHDTSETEHIEISNVTVAGQMIYGLSSMPVSVTNISDGAEEENWGIYVQITLDYPVTGVADNEVSFKMVSSAGTTYTCNAVTVSDDGLILTLELLDFNLAKDLECTVSYTPGSIQSPATAMEAWSISFYPVNLVLPETKIPKPIRAVNV